MKNKLMILTLALVAMSNVISLIAKPVYGPENKTGNARNCFNYRQRIKENAQQGFKLVKDSKNIEIGFRLVDKPYCANSLVAVGNTNLVSAPIAKVSFASKALKFAKNPVLAGAVAGTSLLTASFVYNYQKDQELAAWQQRQVAQSSIDQLVANTVSAQALEKDATPTKSTIPTRFATMKSTVSDHPFLTAWAGAIIVTHLGIKCIKKAVAKGWISKKRQCTAENILVFSVLAPLTYVFFTTQGPK